VLIISAKPVELGLCLSVDSSGRTDLDCMRLVVRADEKLTAFMELESVIRAR
jgi:hypothetical protein